MYSSKSNYLYNSNVTRQKGVKYLVGLFVKFIKGREDSRHLKLNVVELKGLILVEITILKSVGIFVSYNVTDPYSLM